MCVCSVITRVLVREGGRQENQSQRRCEDGSRGWSNAIAGSKDGGRGHSRGVQGPLETGNKTKKRASLVAQWLRIPLPMQGTWVRALVLEDPTCHGATKPVRHNY